MKIISKKKEAIEELKRISTRTNSENNNKINAIVEEVLIPAEGAEESKGRKALGIHQSYL